MSFAKVICINRKYSLSKINKVLKMENTLLFTNKNQNGIY